MVFAVFVVAYGLGRYVILNPDENRSISTVVGILMVPYFQLFGELFLDYPKDNRKWFETIDLVYFRLYLHFNFIFVLHFQRYTSFDKYHLGFIMYKIWKEKLINCCVGSIWRFFLLFFVGVPRLMGVDKIDHNTNFDCEILKK